MICFICLGRGNASTIKTKCCNQPFHVDCLDLWVKQEKFTCPMYRKGDEFMASLTFQKFLATNAKGTLPPSHKTNLVILEALTEALDHILTLPFGWYIKRSNRFAGKVIVRTARAPEHPIGRPLRSNTANGFFFDYK